MTSIRRPGLARLNSLLDELPRTTFGALAREAPAFRSCGVAGYHVALAATLAAALLGGRSPLVAAALAAVSAWSFLVHALIWRRVRGRERLVLLEHVWVTLACTAPAAWWLGAGAGALDPVAVGLAFFLAFGRVGCTLAGCCHGRPSSVGLVYDERHVSEGFPSHLVGIRLFPVQPLEAAGLLAIGVTGLAAMPFARPGHVLAGFLFGYAVLRFGLEGLRGDRRPHLLGLSQARWMAIAEAAFAIAWLERERTAGLDRRSLVAWGLLAVTLSVALVLKRSFDARARLSTEGHRRELRSLLASLGASAGGAPRVAVSSRGVSLALSTADGAEAHVSLALPGGLHDLRLACELATAILPSIDAGRAELGDTALHLRAPLSRVGDEPNGGVSADALHGEVVRKAQRRQTASVGDEGPPAPSRGTPSPTHPEPRAGWPPGGRGYFLSPDPRLRNDADGHSRGRVDRPADDGG